METNVSLCSMSDKSELKAELERKKQRIAQIREEKKRKEEEKKKKDVRTVSGLILLFSVIKYAFCVCMALFW